jgi:hypothetical protein
MGELSVILILLLSIVIAIFFEKIKKSWFINFLNIYIIIFFIINLMSFFNIQKESYKNVIENPKIFADLTYFSSDEVKKILNNKNNKNIYYIIMDGAISLNIYNDRIKKINLTKIISEFKKDNFIYIHDVDSSYPSTATTLSQILNLSYFKDKNNLEKWDRKEKFGEIFRYFNESPLGKTLDDINYNFFWLGNSFTHCRSYNISICFPAERGLKAFLRSLSLNNRTNLMKTNYVLMNFLQKTPFLDFTHKYFFLGKSGRELALFENDAVNNYIKFSHSLPKNEKNHFIFIHAFMPVVYFLPHYNPLAFNEDCTMRIHSKDEIKDFKHKSITDPSWRTYELYKSLYEKNYLCMLKRVDEFTKFINIFDPDAMVIFQADHGSHGSPELTDNYGNRLNKVFTLIKTSNECEDHLLNKIDNINAIRLLLSCATDTQFKFLDE